MKGTKGVGIPAKRSKHAQKCRGTGTLLFFQAKHGYVAWHGPMPSAPSGLISSFKTKYLGSKKAADAWATFLAFGVPDFPFEKYTYS